LPTGLHSPPAVQPEAETPKSRKAAGFRKVESIPERVRRMDETNLPIMSKPLVTLLVVGFAGMIFYPDETRDIAWKTVGALGNAAANATADAVVAVDDRIEERRGLRDNAFRTENTFVPFEDRDFRSGSRPVQFRDRQSDYKNEPTFVIYHPAVASPHVR
jgi:hypothetical protein